jgi:hypothetical protein
VSDLNWPALIGDMIQTKARVDELDPEHVERYTLPRVRATPAEISLYESELGEALPGTYRDFLLHANGWPAYYFDADLFGLPELRGGASAHVANQILDVLDEEGVLEDLGIARDDALPIVAGSGMRTLFLIIRSGRPHAGQVHWLDGEQVEQFTDFAEFFASMTAYAQQRITKLADESPS